MPRSELCCRGCRPRPRATLPPRNHTEAQDLITTYKSRRLCFDLARSKCRRRNRKRAAHVDLASSLRPGRSRRPGRSFRGDELDPLPGHEDPKGTARRPRGNQGGDLADPLTRLRSRGSPPAPWRPENQLLTDLSACLLKGLICINDLSIAVELSIPSICTAFAG